MKVISKEAKSMGEVGISGQTVHSSREISRIIKFMVMGSTPGLMVRNMKACGSRARKAVKVPL